MKNLGERVIIYIMVGLLTFSVVAVRYDKSVHAMEWVGGALAFEEALKWAMAVLGVTATAGMTDAYWSEYGDEFEEYAIQNGATQTEVANWQMKLCEGILDKGSSVWGVFKNWVSSLIYSSSNDSPVFVVGTAQSIYENICKWYNLKNKNYVINPKVMQSYGDRICYGFFLNFVDLGYNGSSSNTYAIQNIILFLKPDVSVVQSGAYSGSFSPRERIVINFVKNNYIGSIFYTDDNSTYSNNASSYISNNINKGVFFSSVNYIEWGDTSNIDNKLLNLDGVNIDNLDVISSTLPEVGENEVAIPMPGVSDSDNTASSDAYEDIVGRINSGEITQEQGLEEIQDLLKIIVYDTETDDVIPVQPDPDTGENKDKEEVIKENKENMAFTLGGLEQVFPFCIPFDIYAFMTLLVAEPQAPEFDYPIKSVNNKTEVIHVDLEPFEPVAVVVRYVFDFLFIIGLGILTRSLIGAGGSD